MKASLTRTGIGAAGFALGLMCLSACDPFEKQRVAGAEEQRIQCLDKLCYGDTPPRQEPDTAIFKLNGQWYVGPTEYFSSGRNGGGFYWPSKHPMFKGGSYPERGQDVADSVIEIFFTGRQRWPTPNLEKPWEGLPWTKKVERMGTDGFSMERVQLSPILDKVHFRQADGKLYDAEFFIAIQEKRMRGAEPPVLACTISIPRRTDDSCKSGEYWQPDVYADFRISAKHANDWPAIHQEIIRVLNLAKKVQP